MERWKKIGETEWEWSKLEKCASIRHQQNRTKRRYTRFAPQQKPKESEARVAQNPFSKSNLRSAARAQERREKRKKKMGERQRRREHSRPQYWHNHIHPLILSTGSVFHPLTPILQSVIAHEVGLAGFSNFKGNKQSSLRKYLL